MWKNKWAQRCLKQNRPRIIQVNLHNLPENRSEYTFRCVSLIPRDDLWRIWTISIACWKYKITISKWNGFVTETTFCCCLIRTWHLRCYDFVLKSQYDTEYDPIRHRTQWKYMPVNSCIRCEMISMNLHSTNRQYSLDKICCWHLHNTWFLIHHKFLYWYLLRN